MEGMIAGRVFADFASGNKHGGTIHSVFDKVVNIEFPDLDSVDTLLSVGRAGVPVTPAMLVVRTTPGFSWLQWGVQAGQPVWIGNENLHVGMFRISTENALPWQPEECRFKDGCSPKRIAAIVNAFPKNTPATRRLKAALLRDEIHETDDMERALWNGITALKSYLRGDAESWQAVNGLIGLGEGLTPSGDDILAGALHGLFCLDDLERFAPLSNAVKRSLQNTNRISRHFLAYAAEGIWGKREQDFLFSVLTPGARDYVEKAQAFAAVGASSGVDQLLGALLALQVGGSICR